MAEANARRDVTGLLRAWQDGDPCALQSLIPLVERELHCIARACMAGQPPGHTLQPTALVNEAYLRLVDSAPADWQDRSHFLAACSKIMRRILADHARARLAAKRGGGAHVAPLEAAWIASPEPDREIVAVDDGLDALAAMDPRKAQVVEFRFFCGFTVEETAAALGVSEETVGRDWRLARAWLARELGKENPDGPGTLEEG